MEGYWIGTIPPRDFLDHFFKDVQVEGDVPEVEFKNMEDGMSSEKQMGIQLVKPFLTHADSDRLIIYSYIGGLYHEREDIAET